MKIIFLKIAICLHRRVGLQNHSLRKKLFQYLDGGERLGFLFFLWRFDGLETSIEEKVVDDLKTTGNDEGKAEEG